MSLSFSMIESIAFAWNNRSISIIIISYNIKNIT